MIKSESNLTPQCPPGKFYTIPKEIIKLYNLLPDFNANVAVLYAVLRDYRNEGEGGVAWPSKYTLSVDLGISLSTIDRALKTLNRYGLIEIIRREEGNIYRVNDPLPADEFIAKHPQVIEEYRARIEKAEQQRRKDAEKMREWRARKRTDGDRSARENGPAAVDNDKGPVIGYAEDGRPIHF